MIAVPVEIGYAAVLLLVAGETAGALVPGETALIAAAVLAARGHLSLPLVIAAGSVGAIVGDQIGFAIGGRGVRWLLTREGRLTRQRTEFVEFAEEFFAQHGPRAVFLARWMPGLRLWGAWFAGASRMPWRRFAPWNAAGGVAWATSIAGGAYLLGDAADGAFGAGGIVLLAATIAGLLVYRHHRRRA